MHDLIKELRALEQALGKVLISSEMRQLDDIVTRLEAAVATPPPNLISDRMAVLEHRQRDDGNFAQRLAVDLTETDLRLDNLVAAMREVARKDSVHPSVRFLADTIALNLAVAPRPASPPPGYTIGEAAGGYVWRCGDRNSPVYMTPEKAVECAWVDHEVRRV